LIGDSQAREHAEKISNYLGNDYEVTGHVNPSTGLEVIRNSAKKEIARMMKTDAYIMHFQLKQYIREVQLKINGLLKESIKISSKRMRLLDNQSKTTVIEEKVLEYIDQYRKIYRRVIQEAKRRENNTYTSSAKNKSKAAWQVINKELGKSFINNMNIELRWGKNKISKP